MPVGSCCTITLLLQQFLNLPDPVDHWAGIHLREYIPLSGAYCRHLWTGNFSIKPSHLYNHFYVQ